MTKIIFLLSSFLLPSYFGNTINLISEKEKEYKENNFVPREDSVLLGIEPKDGATDSLKVENLEFCPSDEMLVSLNVLNDCCCLKNDCKLPSSESGLAIVNKGINLVIDDYKISGSCWTFANKLYDLAGYPSKNRKVIYKESKGTLLKDPSHIQPGDWVYHVNYSFHNVEHSAIFICWKDFDNRMALTLSHVGQNKYAPGKFGVYDLKGVYSITRAFKD